MKLNPNYKLRFLSSLSFIFFLILVSCQEKPETYNSISNLPFQLHRRGLWTESLMTAEEFIKKEHSKELENELIVLIGQNLRYLEEYDSAYNHFNKGLERGYSENDKYLKAWCNYHIGDLEYIKWAYFKKGSIEVARKRLDQSKELFESISDSSGLASYYYRIGTLAQLDDDPDAQKHFKKSLDIAISIKDTLGIMRSYTHLSTGFRRNAKYDSALIYANMALDFAKEFKSYYSLCHYLSNLGSICMEMKDLQNAKKYFDQGTILAESLGHGILLAKSYLYQMRYYSLINDEESMAFYKAKGKEIAKKLNYNNYIQAFNN